MRKERDEMTATLLRGTVTLLILSALQKGSLTGVEIARAINAAAGELFELKEGTLYAALHALENDGLLSSEHLQDEKTGRTRRVYSVTALGQTERERRLEAWKRVTTVVSRVSGAHPLDA